MGKPIAKEGIDRELIKSSTGLPRQTQSVQTPPRDPRQGTESLDLTTKASTGAEGRAYAFVVKSNDFVS